MSASMNSKCEIADVASARTNPGYCTATVDRIRPLALRQRTTTETDLRPSNACAVVPKIGTPKKMSTP